MVKAEFTFKVEGSPSTKTWFITVDLDRCFGSHKPKIVSSRAALLGERLEFNKPYTGFIPTLSKYKPSADSPHDSSLVFRYFEQGDRGLFVKKTQAVVYLSELKSGRSVTVRFHGRDNQKVVPFDGILLNPSTDFEKDRIPKVNAGDTLMRTENSKISSTIREWFDTGKLKTFNWSFNMSGFGPMQNISFLMEEESPTSSTFWSNLLNEAVTVRRELGLPLKSENLMVDMLCLIPSRIFDYTLDLFGDDFESPFIQRNGDCEDMSYAILSLFDALKKANLSDSPDLLKIQNVAKKYCGMFTICSSLAPNMQIVNNNDGNSPVVGHVCTLFIPISRIHKMIPQGDDRISHAKLLMEWLNSKYDPEDSKLPILLGEGTNYVVNNCSVYDDPQDKYSVIYDYLGENAKIFTTTPLADQGSGFYDKFIQCHTTQFLFDTKGIVNYTGFVLTSKSKSREYGICFSDLLDPANSNDVALVPIPSLSSNAISLSIDQARILTPVPTFGDSMFEYSPNSVVVNDIKGLHVLIDRLQSISKKLKERGPINKGSTSKQLFFINTAFLEDNRMDKLEEMVMRFCTKMEYEMFNPCHNCLDFRITTWM